LRFDLLSLWFGRNFLDGKGLWEKILRPGYDFWLFVRSGDMPQGTVKKVLADKGFGFIEGERGDLFFHHSAVEGTSIEALRVGQKVTYEEGRGPKGPRAEHVKPV
jgi:CspA family cold shock protein